MRIIFLGYLMKSNDIKLANTIFNRKVKDNFRCCNCGYHNKVPFINRELHGHHTYNKKNYPKLKYNINYLRTLCEKCHSNFHIKYKGGYNKKCTLYDYYIWRIIQELYGVFLIKIIYKLFR